MVTSADLPTFLTVPEVHEKTHIPVATLWLMIRRGELVACKVGRRYLIPVSVLDDLLRQSYAEAGARARARSEVLT